MSTNKVIELISVSKVFRNGSGLHDVSFFVSRGEAFGFIGPNGAGKTTTIRCLLGFNRVQSGTITINGLDCWSKQPSIHNTLKIGYLPGELPTPDDMTGWGLIEFFGRLNGVKDFSVAKNLLNYFDMHLQNIRFKKMSKGMKQKICIVCAFMHDPELLILDEPTSGLDPLMQEKFIQLVLQYRQRGKTILLSTHIFSEVEKICQRSCFIKDGRIISNDTLSDILDPVEKTYKITLKHASDLEKVCQQSNEKIFHIVRCDNEENAFIAKVENKNIDIFLKWLSKYDVAFFIEIKNSLERHFLKFYSVGDLQSQEDSKHE